jgi:hypothetical protein
MAVTRRDFMKSVGISITSIILARCTPIYDQGNPQVSTKVPSEPTMWPTPSIKADIRHTPTTRPTSEQTLAPSATELNGATLEATSTAEIILPSQIPDDTLFPFKDPSYSAKARFRECWLHLDWLADQSKGDYERGKWARDLLDDSYRSALNELTASGAMSEATAQELAVAFREATNHVFLSSVPVTCYD